MSCHGMSCHGVRVRHLGSSAVNAVCEPFWQLLATWKPPSRALASGLPRAGQVRSGHVMCWQVMSGHVTSRHVTSRHVMSCHVMSCHVRSCHVTSCHVMSWHVTSCHVMPCRWTRLSWPRGNLLLELSPVACRAQPCAKRCKRTENTAQDTTFAIFGDVETSLRSSRQWPALRNRAQNARNVAKTLHRPRFSAIFVHLDASRRGRKKLTRVAGRTNVRARGQKSSKNHRAGHEICDFWVIMGRLEDLV